MLKYAHILIYLFFVYLLVWGIYFSNQEIFLNEPARETANGFFNYLPSIVLLLFGALLGLDLMFDRRKLVVFDSIFTAAILLMIGNRICLFVAIPIVVFALVMAFVHLQRKESSL